MIRIKKASWVSILKNKQKPGRGRKINQITLPKDFHVRDVEGEKSQKFEMFGVANMRQDVRD